MITLYIKTHNITGLKYFGMTKVNETFEQIHKYKGSGVYWKRHIKKYGYNVTTEIYDQFDERDEIQKTFAIASSIIFSIKNNIVESKEWANLMNETCFITDFNDNMKKKSHETKSIIDNNGLTSYQRAGKKISNFLNTVQDNGQTVAKNKGTKISQSLNVIEENGLTKAHNIAISNGIKNALNGTFKNENNPRAIKIKIFNSNNELIHDCNGTFLKICKEYNLSKTALKVSYENNGQPCFTNGKKVFKKYKHMIGWYAIKENK